MICMLTGLNMLSLSRECVFYRLKHIEKGEHHEIEIVSSLSIKIKYING